MDTSEGFFPERELLAHRRSLQALIAERGERFLPSPPPVDPDRAAAENQAVVIASLVAMGIV